MNESPASVGGDRGMSWCGDPQRRGGKLQSSPGRGTLGGGSDNGARSLRFNCWSLRPGHRAAQWRVERCRARSVSAATGLRLKVRGDGRVYQVRLRQDDRFDGIAWRAELPASTQWQTVTLDFKDFEPVFRGRRVIDAGPVVPAKIRQIGFMVADKTAGPFRLEIGAIHFTNHQSTTQKSS